jgi:GTP:adenosylcobinamide-phosphate guanylyltransferase
MDCLILAGGEASPDLVEKTGVTQRALIPFGGAPMICRVLDALRGVDSLENIAVVADDVVLQTLDGVQKIAAQGRMVDNLLRGLESLSSDEILVCTCDIPLVTAQTFEEFLSGARVKNLEAAYPIVRRAVSEKQFPGGERTYVKLRDGEFTGGNCVLLPRKILPQLREVTDTVYNARKNPLALAKLLGPGFLLRFLTRQLQVAQIEAKAATVLGCRVGAVEMQDASIAFDVDKAAHLETALQKV